MIEIDGSEGEGGGQMLRTSLGLSLVTGQPFRLVRVRAKRSRPGLLRQHLTALRAAAAVAEAEVTGDALGSTEVVFRPRRVRAGEHAFAVGTAGSATLVFQTVLPGLLAAEGESVVSFEGGTENSHAPPFDHLAEVYVPWLRRMGADVEVTLERRGFYPAGGGRFVARVRGGARLRGVEALARHGEVRVSGLARVAGTVPFEVARREAAVLIARLGLGSEAVRCETVASAGPGNTAEVFVRHDEGVEVFVGFGERGKPAEAVANELANEVLAYLAHDVPVSTHTADQLLLLCALGEGGRFRTLAPTQHTRTQATVVRRFLPVDVRIERDGDAFRIDVHRRA